MAAMQPDDLQKLVQTLLNSVDNARDKEGTDREHEPGASGFTSVLGFLIDEASSLLDRLRQHFVDPEDGAQGTVDQAPPVSTVPGKSFLETIKLIIAQVLKEPDILARHYAEFASEAIKTLENEPELR